ncbi:MAG: 50S ribosomal protein L32 [Oscillospiraceae bacterium]|jgi:large subunit ribosomal protein L32|nr:50S ribosomal protein L32 [Oscillospiraceae bacterium]
MAVPKRKTSKARKNKRRSNVWKLPVLNLAVCPHCKSFKLPHRVCKTCGYYKGREIIKITEEAS